MGQRDGAGLNTKQEVHQYTDAFMFIRTITYLKS